MADNITLNVKRLAKSGESPDTTFQITAPIEVCMVGGAVIMAQQGIPGIKSAVEQHTGVQAAQQRLIFRGRVLLDTDTMAGCGLESGMTLHMVPKPPQSDVPPPQQQPSSTPPRHPAMMPGMMPGMMPMPMGMMQLPPFMFGPGGPRPQDISGSAVIAAPPQGGDISGVVNSVIGSIANSINSQMGRGQHIQTEGIRRTLDRLANYFGLSPEDVTHSSPPASNGRVVDMADPSRDQAGALADLLDASCNITQSKRFTGALSDVSTLIRHPQRPATGTNEAPAPSSSAQAPPKYQPPREGEDKTQHLAQVASYLKDMGNSLIDLSTMLTVLRPSHTENGETMAVDTEALAQRQQTSMQVHISATPMMIGVGADGTPSLSMAPPQTYTMQSNGANPRQRPAATGANPRPSVTQLPLRMVEQLLGQVDTSLNAYTTSVTTFTQRLRTDIPRRAVNGMIPVNDEGMQLVMYLRNMNRSQQSLAQLATQASSLSQSIFPNNPAQAGASSEPNPQNPGPPGQDDEDQATKRRRGIEG